MGRRAHDFGLRTEAMAIAWTLHFWAQGFRTGALHAREDGNHVWGFPEFKCTFFWGSSK